MQQSVDFASVIPIKKRRFPVIESASPSSTETPSIAEVNKEESHIFTAATDKSDLSKSPPIVATNTSVENSESKTKNPEPAINFNPTDDFRNKDDSSLAEEYAKEEVLPRSSAAHTMKVKQEIEGTEKNELPLEPKPLILHSSEHENSENSCRKSDRSDPSFLSLDLSKEKLDTRDNNDMATKNVGSRSSANRSNWDLNTSMEEWEGSTNNDSFSGMSEFSNVSSSSNHDVKTTAGLSLTKGERTVTKRSSNSNMASIQQNEPGDLLGLSLGVPSREFDASGKHSFLCKKPDTGQVGPNFNKKNAIMNFASRVTVKPEPVTEVSKSEFSTKSSNCDMGLSNSSSTKRELVEKQIGPHKLVEHGSIKSELIHERNNQVFKFKDSVRPQNVGRVMQHQESTASSSAMTGPLTPQNSCPSKSSTCTELNIISTEQSQFSFHSEEALIHMNRLREQITCVVSKPFSQDGQCNAWNLTVETSEKLEPTQSDGRSSKSRGNIEINANEEERINLSTEMLEEEDTLRSDSESYENRGVSTPKKLCNKEDGEYEEGEVRTPLQNSAREDSFVDTKKTGNDLRIFQPFVLSGDQSTNTSDYNGKSAISENHDENHSDHIKECIISGYEPKNEENSSRKVGENVPEMKVDEKRSIGITLEKRVDFSRERVVKTGHGEEATVDGPSTGPVDKATDTGNKQICSAKHDSTLSVAEESNGNDASKDSNNASNKSRIITLPRASAAMSSYRTRSFPNRAFTSSSGNERYSDLDGDTQPQKNRNEHYTDKFGKNRVRDPSFRNSRPSFMGGRGRGYGRLGPKHNDWGSDNDFASETYNGPSNYRGNRNKHTSSDSDRGGYRRKVMNDEKFMRHLPEDTIDPSYNRSQNMYAEYDGQIIRDKRNFSRKGYPQIQSKSPVRSRTRSPGPWQPSHRRSPDGLQELNNHRSPPVYRMRRMRSPGHSYHEEMVSRRRGGSPPFISRHSDDLRDVDSHVHPRSFNSNRRSPPSRIFPRSERRDVLDARETGDVSVEERRKFVERRGPINSFRPSYNGDGDNFHFHPNDGPSPYRFCQDGDTEFAERSNMRDRDFEERNNSMRDREFEERSNMREREFDGGMTNQSLVASRRIRGVGEQQDGSYGPNRRVWHDEGFSDGSGQKRRRF